MAEMKNTPGNMDGHFKWKKSSSKFETPLHRNLVASFKTSTAYLMEHPNEVMLIVGWYTAEETNKTDFENLGLARAHEIKKLFLQKGVKENQIALSSEEKENSFIQNNLIKDGIHFSFSNKNAPIASLAGFLFGSNKPKIASTSKKEVHTNDKKKVHTSDKKEMPKKNKKPIVKKKKRRWLLPLLAALIIAMIVAAYFQSKDRNKATEVEISVAEKRIIKETVSASGKIFPIQEVKISSDVSGEIIDLYVNEGDSVTAGQILVRIDSEVYASAVERGNASVSGSRSRLEQAKASAESSEANIGTLQAQLNAAMKIMARSKKLFEEGVIAEADFENAEAEVNRLKASIKASRATANSAKASIKSAQSDVESAQASLKELRTNLNRTTISAPSSGVISVLNVEKGERVVGTAQMTGTEMMRIANMNTMEVQVEVSENDILRVGLADSVEIEVDAYIDRKFQGVVSEIANSAVNANTTTSLTSDEVTNFIVTVIIDPNSYYDIITSGKIPFRPGMSASVDINTDTQECISIPIQAVTTRSKEDLDKSKKKSSKKKDRDDLDEDELAEVVFIMDADTAKLVKVTTGIQNDEFIEVSSGIKNGDVVVSGPYSIISRKLEEGEEIMEKEEKEDNKEDDTES